MRFLGQIFHGPNATKEELGRRASIRRLRAFMDLEELERSIGLGAKNTALANSRMITYINLKLAALGCPTVEGGAGLNSMTWRNRCCLGIAKRIGCCRITFARRIDAFRPGSSITSMVRPSG